MSEYDLSRDTTEKSAIAAYAPQSRYHGVVAAAYRRVVGVGAVVVGVRHVVVNCLGVTPISPHRIIHGDSIGRVYRHGLTRPCEVGFHSVCVGNVPHFEGGQDLEGRVQVTREIGILVVQISG